MREVRKRYRTCAQFNLYTSEFLEQKKTLADTTVN